MKKEKKMKQTTKKERLSRLSLTLTFSLVIFLILFIAIALTIGIIYIMVLFNAIPAYDGTAIEVTPLLLFLAFICLVMTNCICQGF